MKTFVLVALGVLLAASALGQQCPALLGSWLPGGQSHAVAVAGPYVVFNSGSLLVVADFTNPARPAAVGAVSLGRHRCLDIAVNGDLAFVLLDNDQLDVVSLSDPEAPERLGSLSGVPGNRLAAASTCVFCMDTKRLTVVDVSDPWQPSAVASFQSTSEDDFRDVAVHMPFAYLAAESGLHVLELEADSVMEIAVVADRASAVVLHDGRLYLSSMYGFHVFDISEPAYPIEMGGISSPNSVSSVHVSEDLAVLFRREHQGFLLAMVDVSDPTDLAVIGNKFLPAKFARSMAVAPGLAFVATLHGVSAIDTSDPAVPFEAGFYRPLPDPGEDVSMAISGTLGYATGECDDGHCLLVFDLSRPAQQMVVSAAPMSSWNGNLELSGDHVFVQSGGFDTPALEVFDVSDPLATVKVAIFDYPETRCSASFALAGRYAFTICGNQLYVLDISEPTQPQQVGSCSLPGNRFPVEVVTDDGLVCVSWRQGDFLPQEGGFDVIDITDPTAPVWQSRVENLSPWGGSLAIHGRFLYYLPGLTVYDLSEADSPVEVTHLGDSLECNAAVAMEITGNIAFLACYNDDGEDELLVLGLSDPLTPEVLRIVQIPHFEYSGTRILLDSGHDQVGVVCSSGALSAFDYSCLMPTTPRQPPGRFTP